MIKEKEMINKKYLKYTNRLLIKITHGFIKIKKNDALRFN